MRAGIVLVAASLVLAGCGGASSVRLAGMSDLRSGDFTQDPVFAACPRMMVGSTIAPDSLAFMVAELLKHEYGHRVCTDALATELCECFRTRWLNAALFEEECVKEAPEGEPASEKGTADILLFGLFPHGGHGGFRVSGVDSRSGRTVIAAVAEGETRAITMNEQGERVVITQGAPLGEFASVLAEALDWQLEHPGETHGSLKRLEKGQPRTKVLTSKDKRQLVGGR